MQKSPQTDELAASSGNGIATTTTSSSTAAAENSVSTKPPEENDFEINLNDFLEFLKLSCHVNDMITRSEKPKDPTNNNTTSTINYIPNPGNLMKTKTNADGINFSKLANHQLVNNLFGLKPIGHRNNNNNNNKSSANHPPTQSNSRDDGRNITSTSIPTTTTGTSSKASRPELMTPIVPYKGLHPKLHEKLDYVINEGIMDSVLSFICPMPMPSPLMPGGGGAAGGGRTVKGTKQQKPIIGSTTTLASASSSYVSPEVTGQSSPGRQGQAKDSTSLTSSTSGTSLQTGSGTSITATTATSSESSSNVVRATVRDASKTSLGSAVGNRRKSLLLMKDKSGRHDKKEPEVIIHVCDEVKNTSRDFSCPQHLLVTKMGYFADVTAGQRLEEMDISVHCDIQIFDWLMRWVKHSVTTSMELQSPTTPGTPGPQLDGNNVVPILVSASFLQMEPLLLECLAFCHAHLSEVVRTSTNLSCLNDAIVTRLAAMFTNLELEMVRDKKERVTPRLWTKLIQSLCEPEPEALRGHFYSMSGLFRCNRCQNCVTNTMKSYVGCVPSNIRLNRWGQLISHHVRDSSWDINSFIVQLFKELKSWRKVYWKLWGHCHYLYCCICEAHFPVYQMNWCRYHTEGPNFLGPVSEGRIAGPAGRYSCCGQQSFRYETLPGPNGCQFREHSVLVETDRERSILAIAQLVCENYALCEPPPMRMQELAAAGEISPCWQGIALTPQRCRQGLLPQIFPEGSVNLRISRRMRHGNVAAGGGASYFESSSESDTTSSSEDDIRMSRTGSRLNTTKRLNENDDSTTSSDGCESEHRRSMSKVSLHKKKRGKRNKRKRPNEFGGRFWSGELSARSNQDHQREFEEKVMKQVIAYVNKKTGSDQNVPQQPQPMGGTFIRLEAEWREMLKQRSNHQNSGNYNNTNAGGGPNAFCSGYLSGGAGGSNSNSMSVPYDTFKSSSSKQNKHK